MRRKTLTAVAVAAGILMTATLAAGADAAQASNAGKRPLRVVIYPILVQLPVFGASIDLPALPSIPPGGGGGEAGGAEGSTDISLNAAYMAGFLVEADRFFVDMSGTWADVSADRQTPHVSVGTDTRVFTARGGVRLFKDFSATAGVHWIGSKVDLALDLPLIGASLQGHVEPSFWDPMIGVDWRKQFGRWNLDASFEGGGFGVGTDVELTGGFRADYRMGHFDLRLGYEMLHYKWTLADVSIGRFQREVVSSQTLHGPSIGFGIVF